MMARARNVRQTRRNRRCRTDDQDNLGGDNGAQPKIVIVAKRRDQKPGYDEPGAGEACENREDEFFRPRQSATQHDSEPDGGRVRAQPRSVQNAVAISAQRTALTGDAMASPGPSSDRY
jgi:hypothetical protein